ncbi:hybrid sensor histidine kinase/response regulator transcription factor [Mucilaginibacter terrae]|uniref:hybrid sensor histidine kinase/response regulator transcription factor n=1 Tax=Mucilaginibacter terrae TaxID=1955052 RepID=UPI00366AC92B
MHFSLNEGLSQSPIFSIKQDKQGFIWIGSRDGLTRFDGYEFKIYKNYSFDKKSTNHRDINAIHEDAHGNIWIGASSGLYVFNKNKEQYNHIPVNGVGFISCFMALPNNRLLIGTNRGIKLLNCATRQIKSYSSFVTGNVYSLFQERSGKVWVGLNTGVICLNSSLKNKEVLPPQIKNNIELFNAKVVAIKQDLDGDLWFGTEDAGLFWYKYATKNIINFTHKYHTSASLASDFIRDVYVHNQGQIWIATRNGLSIFNKQSQTFTNHQHHSDDQKSLSNNTIWNIMKDAAGSIWLTTYAGGLNIYNPANANFINIGERIGGSIGLNQPVVNAIVKDENGGLWAGTDGGGLNFIDNAHQMSSYFSVQDLAQRKNSNIIKALAPNGKDKLWVGTLDGLASINKSGGKISYLSFDGFNVGLKNTRINALLTTPQGIWVAADVDGLKWLSTTGQKKEFYVHQNKNSISSNHTNALMHDANTGIWIGTNNGLNHYDLKKQKFDHYLNDPARYGYNSNVVLSLFTDRYKRVWVGTRAGLQLFNPRNKQVYFITEQHGLTNNVIQAIAEDKQGNLWVSTNNGLSKISFLRYNPVLKQVDYKIFNYTSTDGLASNQFMPNAVCSNKDGELLFGGVNGITAFYPEHIIKNTHQPNVIITEFMIHNQVINISSPKSPLKQPIENTRSITLKHHQNFISFKFSALNFVNTNKNVYAYKLQGLRYNNTWHYVNHQRLASYTGLAPGTYTFSVKAANNDGVWNNNGVSVDIEILPPFWLTWWAYVLYTLLFVGVLFAVIRFFRRQAQLERDLYYEHLQYERQQELHQMKLDFFTNISHELRTPLTLLSGPVEKLIAETQNNELINKQLYSIQNNTNRLLRLINELMDFRKAESGKIKLQVKAWKVADFTETVCQTFNQVADAKHITYSFNNFAGDTALYFDSLQMEKVFFNLLSNAFKFTHEGGVINVEVKDEGREVGIYITDNGQGIPFHHQEKLFTNFYQAGEHHQQNSGSGVGLAFSKSIVELHHGAISFESLPEEHGRNGSTCFKVSLLKGSSHFEPDELVVDANEIYEPFETETRYLPETARFPDLEIINNSESKYTVLIVEDNNEVREFLVESLKETYTVQGCENGSTGFITAINSIPDLVISDVMMPEMDGMELCGKLKADERTSHIPVILLTARATTIHQVSGLTTGADAYITKPFSLQLLKLNVHNLLAARKVMQNKFSQQVTLQPKDVVINNVDEAFLSKLMKIVEDKMEDSEFDVMALSVEIGMSRPVLYRKIKGLTDLSVADFLKVTRLKRAATLLVQNKMGIADIAFSVGFSNRKHFSKEFRKQFGCAPTAYAATYENTATASMVTHI